PTSACSNWFGLAASTSGSALTLSTTPTGRSPEPTSRSTPTPASGSISARSGSPARAARRWSAPVPEPELAPEQILAELAEHGVRYVLIGGFAAVIHGSPYVTVDVD